MGQKTVLYPQHQQAGAKIVDFAGWDMPLNYGSQIEEHHTVRRDAGMFDVSHMAVVDIQGAQAHDYLRYLLANDIAKLQQPGQALYSCMLNDQAGIVDDLIVYFLSENFYRLVLNASMREKDIAWLQKHTQNFSVNIIPRNDFAILAVQGPKARERVSQVLHLPQIQTLLPFHGFEHNGWFIARTGYTGEDGVEMLIPNEQVSNCWQALLAAGIKPCGLGARDTLRLEAGLNLYGADMDETTSPLESNLAWTVARESHDFIGKKCLTQQTRRLVGLLLEEKGVLRNHQKIILDGLGEGEITSGSFSPTIGKAIAFARIPVGKTDKVWVDMRGKLLPVRIVKPPFVRLGRILIHE